MNVMKLIYTALVDYSLKIVNLIFLLSLIFIFTNNAFAISLFSPTPVNGSYITGGAIYNFTIFTSIVVSNFSYPENVVVKLHFGSQEVWPNNRSIYNMTCNEINESSLFCHKEIEIVAAESGTREYYFFEAFEDGNYTSLGNLTSPLFVIIDRMPPRVTSVNFVNNSYISTNKIIEVIIEDLHSGVDNSSTIAFIEINDSIIIQNITQFNKSKIWKISINTTNLDNNISVNIYVNASDILGNKNMSLLGTAYIDNEYPEIKIISPNEGEEIRGIYLVNFSILERYSKINNTRIKIENINFDASCQNIGYGNYSCLANINTSLIPDGNYSIEIYALDDANNSAMLSIPISINNKKPTIYLETPNYAKGIIQINASVLGRKDIVSDVFIRISDIEEKMSCSQDFSLCSYLLNTTKFKDGAYTIFSYAKNIYNYSVNATKEIIIDNTPPSILLIQDFSSIYIKGNFSFVIIVTDEFPLNENDIKLRFANRENVLSCTSTLQGRKLHCGGILDSTLLEDGKNNITFIAKDLASNIVSRIVEITVDNHGPKVLSLIVEPSYSKEPTTIYFEALIKDEVSEVSWARLIIRARNETFTLNLRNESKFRNSQFFSSIGSHYVDIQVSDINDNVEYYANVGYFYIGIIACGDNVCQDHENYCICEEDCAKPRCNENENISCAGGIPKCVKLNICGNGICEENENCISCKEDCGVCINYKNITTTTITKISKNESSIDKDDKSIDGTRLLIERFSHVIKENYPYIFIAILIAIALLIIIKIKMKKRYVIIVKLDKNIK